jgi:hypothetical protein
MTALLLVGNSCATDYGTVQCVRNTSQSAEVKERERELEGSTVVAQCHRPMSNRGAPKVVLPDLSKRRHFAIALPVEDVGVVYDR